MTPPTAIMIAGLWYVGNRMALVVTADSAAYTDWLIAHDTEVEVSWVRRCVLQREYCVAVVDGQVVGFLRFSQFWGKIPFMDMVRVQASHQRAGVGTALFSYWEAAMRTAGATLLMTSSQADEPEPVAWHKRNGFVDAGAVQFGHLQLVKELFLIKDLRDTSR